MTTMVAFSARRKPSLRGTAALAGERREYPRKEKDEDEENHVDVPALSLFQREESEFVDVHLFKRTPVSIPESPARALKLRQYNTSDSRWGIYSSVWDGGLGMVAWLHYRTRWMDPDNAAASYWARTVVVDLGSGTGIVGLACAALSRGRAAVHLTDLPEALELLQGNVIRNAHLWERTSKSAKMPLVHPLTWGEPIDDRWVEEIVSQAKSGKRKRILILGADIVYRVSLFQPLLGTLNELMARIAQHSSSKLEVECVLACSSTRTHLGAFWKTARNLQGCALEWKATVKVPEEGNGLQLDQALVTPSLDPHAPPEEAPVGPGLVSIVQLRKLPFSFSI
jgi:predicted nicotinamide N-methyase